MGLKHWSRAIYLSKMRIFVLGLTLLLKCSRVYCVSEKYQETFNQGNGSLMVFEVVTSCNLCLRFDIDVDLFLTFQFIR